MGKVKPFLIDSYFHGSMRQDGLTMPYSGYVYKGFLHIHCATHAAEYKVKSKEAVEAATSEFLTFVSKNFNGF